jgi:hypothetical protein
MSCVVYSLQIREYKFQTQFAFFFLSQILSPMEFLQAACQILMLAIQFLIWEAHQRVYSNTNFNHMDLYVYSHISYTINDH